MADTQQVRGTKDEKKLFTEVSFHYDMAKEDLDKRRVDFDKKDILFRSHIDEGKWPYNAIMFDPRVFTALYEKTARTFANKPKGRVVPRGGGADVMKAKIVNELLSFQWDENERVDAQPMLAKWALMDLNARKYGAAFGLVKWQYECKYADGKKSVFYDGPQFIPMANRDCLANPSYSTVKNWFQHREYLTLNELTLVNDVARSKPIYKNLDLLRMSIKEESTAGGDSRESNYNIKNKTIKGLQDFLGRDEYFKVVEVVTEYQENRWVTFAPKHGVVLRDIPNPYHHGQIPVVQLKYYPIDDDLYGLSEIEPIEKLQKAINAILSQYIDAVNMSLYAPLKVRATGGAVQMHTLEFGPGKLWLMQDPSSDVVTHDSSPTGVTEFASTYRFLVSALQEGLGETSQGISSLNPGSSGKTATEVRDTAESRSARDNFNQIFLEEALKKQMGFWHVMNQQYLFSDPKETTKIIQIVGKDALAYFKKAGLDATGISEEAESILTAQPEDMEGIDIKYEDYMEPLYPVETQDGIVPKLQMSEDDQMGELLLEKNDLSGLYDYIPDIDSMRLPDKGQEISALKEAITLSLEPTTQQLLAQEQTKLKIQDLLEDYYERLGVHDASKYFEKLEVDPMMQNEQIDPETGQPIVPTGAGGAQGFPGGMANGQLPGMEGIYGPVPNGEAQPIVS